MHVAVATNAGKLAMRLGCGNGALLGGDDFRVVKLTGLAHVDQQVVRAHMDHVHPRHGRDGLDIAQAFHGFDHAHHQGGVVQGGHALGQRHSGVVKVRVATAHRALANRGELGRVHCALRLLGVVHIGKHNACHAVVQVHRHIGVVDAAHPHLGGNAATQRHLGHVANGLEVEQRVLHIDEHKVVSRGFGNANDVT